MCGVSHVSIVPMCLIYLHNPLNKTAHRFVVQLYECVYN